MEKVEGRKILDGKVERKEKKKESCLVGEKKIWKGKVRGKKWRGVHQISLSLQIGEKINKTKILFSKIIYLPLILE